MLSSSIREAAGDFKFGSETWVFGDQPISAGVITTAGSRHLYINNGVVHLGA